MVDVQQAGRFWWVFLLVPVLAIAVWLASTSNKAARQQAPEEAEESKTARAEAERALVEAALARIAAESAGTAPEIRIEAPPNLPAAPTSAPPRPTPPSGYSFTTFHGEMARGRMAEQDYEADADPIQEHEWLEDAGAVAALAAQAAAAGRDWTFGWVGVAPGSDRAALTQRLARLGATVLGRSGNLLRMRLPGSALRLERIARLDAVSALAPTPEERKLPAALAAEAWSKAAEERFPAFVTLMTDDSDGRWRQALTRLGAVVGRFDQDVRAYTASVPYGALDAIAGADFVLAVEPIAWVEFSHDTAVPAMGADALRLYDESTGLFTGVGGASVPIGLIDSGLNINHGDIASNRQSICGANFSSDLDMYSARIEDLDLWFDAVGHGTHVTGTMAGNGQGDPRFAGMAPLVQHIRIARAGSADFDFDALNNIAQGMDFLADSTTCGHSGAPAVKPALVNMSLGVTGLVWEGRSVGERKLDAVVWNARQLYVVANANSAFKGNGNFGNAKNALAVGATQDSGDLARFSSHGPSFDGRLKPQVVATGVNVLSARGNGARGGYDSFSGTSMSSPSVAGVAALVMDAVPEFRDQPAAVRARLMASAVKPDAFLDDPHSFPLHNGDGPGRLQNRYGLGKVSARTSVLNRDEGDGWTSGSAIVEVGDGEYGFHDIMVPEGASRLDIAMTWDERPADTLVQAVLNDLDLWVDRDADCAPSQPASCGDAASRSVKDNVEWLILRNPSAGLYRLKVVPKRTLVETPRAAVAWTIIRGPSTPQLDVRVDEPAVAAAPGRPFEVDATISADGYVAAGVNLRIDCRGEDGSTACSRVEYLALRASRASREDGVARSLRGETGDAIALGEVAVGEEQRIRLVFRSLDHADRFRLYFTANAWNATGASASIDVTVGESTVAASPVASRPANDDFAAATQLRGDSGSHDFDLLLATPEPGEPPFRRGLENEFGRFQSTRRPRSIWYSWTAPAADTFRFSIAPSAPGDMADNVQMDLFEAGASRPLASLTSVGARAGGLSFAAERRQTYRVRLGLVRESLLEYSPEDEELNELVATGPPAQPIGRRPVVPLSLHWRRGARPANDDFALARVLQGDRGSIEDSNQGATLEGGEFFSRLVATTWYRWTAPASGDWRFEVDRRLNVLAFTGDAVTDLRLVSAKPGQAATFPVREGAEYRIAVAADDAFAAGGDYTLRWMPAARTGPDNDDVAAALPIPGKSSSSHSSGILDFDAATVEPGEPIESGTRTLWWTWTAPADGTYTWHADPAREPLKLSAFAGDAADLTPIAESAVAVRSQMELSFSATAGEQYWIALGLPKQSAFMPTLFSRLSPASFTWGPTPANDDLGAAEALLGASGALAGSNQFATVERGEQVGLFGYSSLWWTWEAPDAKWYRFSLNDRYGVGILAIYRMRGGGTAQLELIATSRRLLGSADLVFKAEAGVRYAIRMGSLQATGGGEFSIVWDENGPPAWLRYAGAIMDGDIDSAGRLLEIRNPAGMAFNPDGSELYVSSAEGLQVYRRDGESGDLQFAQSHTGTDSDAWLAWDAPTSALLVGACGDWQKFKPAADGGLESAGAISGDAPCPGPSMLRDSSGSFIHILHEDWKIETYRLNDERTAIEWVGDVPVEGVRAAAISGNDGYLYVAASPGVLAVYAHDAETGEIELLTTVRDGEAVEEDVAIRGLDRAHLLATDSRDGYLLAFGNNGQGIAAFDLQDPAAPRFLDAPPLFGSAGLATAAPPGDASGVSNHALDSSCRFAVMRPTTVAVDLFCSNTVFSARLLPAIPAVRLEDRFRIDENIPEPSSPPVGNALASPDGRQVYAAATDGILVFERLGSL